jgi:hypothetical protein
MDMLPSFISHLQINRGVLEMVGSHMHLNDEIQVTILLQRIWLYVLASHFASPPIICPVGSKVRVVRVLKA